MSPGDDMDRLLEKHAEMARCSNAYALALRGAAATRQLVTRLGLMPSPQTRTCRRQGGIPGAPKSGRRQPAKGRGIGKKAYEWAAATGSTTMQAAARFKCAPAMIHAHRSRYKLPHLPR